MIADGTGSQLKPKRPKGRLTGDRLPALMRQARKEITMAYGFKGLEAKYGVKVMSEGYHYNELTGKSAETFKMFSADGCCWEKGLSRAGVKKECEEWSAQLLGIKKLSGIGKGGLDSDGERVLCKAVI